MTTTMSTKKITAQNSHKIITSGQKILQNDFICMHKEAVCSSTTSNKQSLNWKHIRYWLDKPTNGWCTSSSVVKV